MSENNIALTIVNNRIKNKLNFSLNEIQDEILNNGGILRISPCFTLGEYITELEEDNIIKFDSITEKFIIK